MSKAFQFVTESLGGCGFAVLRGQVAYQQRPDMWATAFDAAHDFADKGLSNRIAGLMGCTTYLVRFQGIDSGLIKVLSRSSDQLAQRIGWVTGFKVSELMLGIDMEGVLDQSNIPARAAGADRGDLHAGVTTKEPGRTCSSCEFFTAGGKCSNSVMSQIQDPMVNTIRRCLGYQAGFNEAQGGCGSVLWPELKSANTITK